MSSFLDYDSPKPLGRRSRYSCLARPVDISQQATINSTLNQSPSTNSSVLNATLQASKLATSIESVATTPRAANSVSIIPASTTLTPNVPFPIQQINDDHQLDVDEETNERLVVYQDFFDNFRAASIVSLEDVLKLAEKFDETCEMNFMVAAKILANSVRPKEEIQYYSKFAHLLRLERDTWRLFRAILGDRIFAQASNRAGDDFDDMEDLQLRLSDKELVQRAMERSSLHREMQVVIDWLESIYQDAVGLDEKVDMFSDGPHYWENTLHALKESKRPTVARKLCPQMDPDASIRTGLPLHDIDREDENRLFHYLFKLIRAGRLMDGKQIAEKSGHYWLSSALEGWILHHDQNFKTTLSAGDPDGFAVAPTSVTELEPIEGNRYRDLWKLTAWKSLKGEGTNMYERGIFAVFSGNRSALLPICSTWHDKLWAYFKCSLDVHTENLMLESNISRPDLTPRSNIDLPEAYWAAKLTAEEIFDQIESTSGGSSVLTEGFGCRTEEQYHQTLQKLLVLGRIDQLLKQVHAWAQAIQAKRESRLKTNKDMLGLTTKLGEDSQDWIDVVEPNLLRFFAHFAMTLTHLELVPYEQESLVAEVVESYLAFLIEEQLVELVAHYTNQLCEASQVRTFATLLEQIEEHDDRKTCLIIAHNEKLNVDAILTTVVDNICSAIQASRGMIATIGDSGRSALLPKVNESDMRKVKALEWLTMDEGGNGKLWMELLWQANILIRTFLIERKQDLAALTFAKLPETDIVLESYDSWRAQPRAVRDVVDIDNLVREYFCHKAFFQAHEAFHEWRHFLYNTKPQEPQKASVMARLADRVAYEQACKQHELDMERWRRQLAQQTQIASERVLAFLYFPERVWCDVKGLNMLAENVLEADADNLSPIVRDQQDEEDVPTVLATVASDTDMEIDAVDVAAEEGDKSNIVLTQLVARKVEAARRRAAQLEALRRLYLPQYCVLLHSIHLESEQLEEALRVADIIADQNAALYETFSKEELTDFLKRIRETSIGILNYCNDPLGYKH